MSPRRTGRARAAVRSTSGPRPVPALGESPRRRPLTVTQHTLDNGLNVLLARKPGAPLVEVRLRVPFGGRTPTHTARAELLASTVLLGTGGRTREQVDAELAAVGGHLDAGVDPQRLSFSGSVLSHGLKTLLAVLADTLTEPAYRRHDVSGERDRLIEQLTLSLAQPSVVARRALQNRRFGTHPVTWEMPEPALVEAVGPAALRSLHQRAVVPTGSVLVLVGDLSPAAALREVSSALAGWTSTRVATPAAGPPPVTAAPLLAVHRDGAVQSQVRFSAAAVTRDDPGYAPAQLANLVYGGYFSSRLVENIREAKGYTYSAHSSFEFWPDRAAVTVAFDTTTPSTVAAWWEARYELGRMTVSPPTAAEIDAARNYAVGTLATSLSTQAGYASTLASLAGQGLTADWLRGQPARLAAVTVEDVAHAAARMLSPTAITGVVVGDLEQIKGPLAALGDVEFE